MEEKQTKIEGQQILVEDLEMELNKQIKVLESCYEGNDLSFITNKISNEFKYTKMIDNNNINYYITIEEVVKSYKEQIDSNYAWIIKNASGTLIKLVTEEEENTDEE